MSIDLILRQHHVHPLHSCIWQMLLSNELKLYIVFHFMHSLGIEPKTCWNFTQYVCVFMLNVKLLISPV